MVLTGYSFSGEKRFSNWYGNKMSTVFTSAAQSYTQYIVPGTACVKPADPPVVVALFDLVQVGFVVRTGTVCLTSHKLSLSSYRYLPFPHREVFGHSDFDSFSRSFGVIVRRKLRMYCTVFTYQVSTGTYRAVRACASKKPCYRCSS